MRFHILGLPHTKTNPDYTACAYTAKVYKFGPMMSQRGHEVIHYGHPDSLVPGAEQVDVITRETYDQVYGAHDFHSEFFRFDTQDPAYQEFYRRATAAIYTRKRPGDFILPFWGSGHRPITDAHPDMICVEPGIGYAGGHWARWKVFESYAMLHAYRGLTAVGTCNMDSYETVIPNYFDPDDFDFGPEPGDYAVFLGRCYDGKGLNIAIQATERAGIPLWIAGQNGARYAAESGGWPSHTRFLGHVNPAQRRQLLSQARCTIVASQYLEPFGGVMIESLFSGTPIITSDWGAATENNLPGLTGYRCRTMEEYVWAIGNISKISRSYCRDYAVNNFSLEVIGHKYEEFFRQIQAVYSGPGWYADHNITGIQVPDRWR